MSLLLAATARRVAKSIFTEEQADSGSPIEDSEQGDGQVRLPLDELPVASASSTDLEETIAVEPGPTKTMANKVTGQPKKEKKGRLRSVKSREGTQAPSDRRPLPQRRLGRATQARPDAYALDESPSKPHLEPPKGLKGPPDCSPLRGQLKGRDETIRDHPDNAAKKQTKSKLSKVQHDSSSSQTPLRRSARKQEANRAADLFTETVDAPPEKDDSPSQNPAQTSRQRKDKGEELFVSDADGDEHSASGDIQSGGGAEEAETDPDDPEAPADHEAEVPPAAQVVIQKIRHSELGYSPMKPTNGDNNEEAQTPKRILQPKPSRKRQRGHEAEDIPRRPAKVLSVAPEADVGEVDNTEMPERQVSDDRLLGQLAIIQQLVRATKKVGEATKDGVKVRPPVDLDDADVKAIKRLCSRASEKFARLASDADDENARDPPEELQEIARKTLQLCGKRADLQTDFTDRTKSENIYYYLIPRLVRLLRRMAECYVALDEQEDTGEVSVTVEHLDRLINFGTLIIQMGESANRYARPDPALAIVKPVKYGLIKPLKKVVASFKNYLWNLEEEEQRAEARAVEQEAATQRQIREQERAVEQAKIDELRRKWSQLHEERRVAEWGIIPLSKQMLLRLPEPIPEFDQNGEQFERLQLFGHRVGPTPAVVAEVWQNPWTPDELDALEWGLREYSGPMVFIRIFRRFCGRKQVLNKYNVSQIVTVAADLKEHLRKTHLEQHGGVEDWVEAIPEWTRPHLLLGKENAGGEPGW